MCLAPGEHSSRQETTVARPPLPVTYRMPHRTTTNHTGPETIAARAGEIRVSAIRALRGPNIWRPSPVMQAELEVGSLAGDHPGALLDFSAGVSRAMAWPVGVPTAPYSWGQLVVRLTLDLLRRTGEDVEYGEARPDREAPDLWRIAVGYGEERVADEALRAAARVVRDCLRGDDPEVEAVVAELRRIRDDDRPDASTRAIIDAARARGIPVRRTPGEPAVQLGLGVTSRLVDGALTDGTSAIAVRRSTNAQRTREALARVGLEWPDRQERDVEGGRQYGVLVVGGRVVAAAERRVGTDDGASATFVDRTDEVHRVNRTSCELAASAVGLDIASVRVVSPDIAVPLSANGGMITGVRASPSLAAHLHPDVGAPRDVGVAIVDMLYPEGTASTIPIVAITGTNGKTTTTRLIAHLFAQGGRRTGFTTTDGVYFNGARLLYGDLTGPFAANIILSHPEVEVAVLETARGGILKSGLGFDRCDIGVVMNVTADHLGLRGIDTVEQLAEVKAVIAASVKPTGYTVLNADDPLVYAMRERTEGRVVLFSTAAAGRSSAIETQLAAGGIVARVEGEGDAADLVVREGAARCVLATVREVPLTFGGRARFQVENVLAACAAAYVGGVSAADIRRGLATFLPSAEQTPGRLNVYETTRGRVMIDYAHNPAALRGLVAFLVATPATRRLALLSAPGDRRDDDLREIGRIAASLNVVIPKEHEVYRRGRVPGAINALITEGLVEAGHPAERIVSFVEEHDAVSYLLDIMRPGDVAAIIADDTAAVAEQLRPWLVTTP